MRISTAVEFYHFAKSNGFANLAPEVQQLINCIDEYGRMCPCDGNEARTAKFNQCRNFYLAFVAKSNSYKASLLGKVADGRITFYNDKQLLASLNR